jgi:hypothetical protein
MPGHWRATFQKHERAVLKELKALASQRYIPSTHLALLCYTLDEKDEAFAWLQKAYDDRDVRLCCAKVDPRWNLMRSDALLQC